MIFSKIFWRVIIVLNSNFEAFKN